MKTIKNIKDREILKISREITEKLNNLFKGHVKNIILYGSYSRGDFKEDSDIDIMVLLDIPDNLLEDYEDALIDEITKLDLKYGKVISVVEKNYTHFMKWVDDLPYYKNIYQEGILLYG